MSFSVTVSAQSDDPFRKGPAASVDPFGDGKSAYVNPFEDAASSKPETPKPPSLGALKQAKQALAKRRQPRVAASSDGVRQRILSSLTEETTQSFVQTPLEEALQQISDAHNIPLMLDRRALEQVGLTTDTPVSIDLRNVSLRSFLRLMLRDLELTYVPTDQVLMITTVEAAEKNLLLEMYKLPPNIATNGVEMVKVMQSSVQPETWSIVGGPSYAGVFEHVLIVSATSDVHTQVEHFLTKLTEKYGD